MKVKKMYASNYLSAADIEDENLTLTVEEVREEEVGQQRDLRPVVYFKEVDKGLVLNKTNMNTICDVLKSDESNDWVGQRITLYTAEIEFQGRMVEGIRVKLRAPKAASAGQQVPAQTVRGQRPASRGGSDYINAVQEGDEEDGDEPPF